MAAGSNISRVRNVLWNWGGFVLTTAISFVLSPFIVHSLGNESYGIWILLGSLVGYLGLLGLGVRGAVTRFIAKYHAQQDHLGATRIASTALSIYSMAGLSAIALASIAAVFVSRLFEIPEELMGTAQVLLILGGVGTAVSMIIGVYGGIIAGLQRFDLINILGIVFAAISAPAIYFALKTGHGLIAMALIQLGLVVIRGVVVYRMSRRLYPEMRTTFSESRRSQMSEILSFSVSVMLLQASGMLILFSDAIVIGAFLPVSMVTFFAIAANLTEYARAPISGISTTLTPSVSALEAGGQENELRRVLLAGARIATLIVLPIVLTFMLRGHSFIGLWMGAEYATEAGDVLWILSLALWFAVGYQIVVSTMMGISKHRGLVPAFVIEAVFNVSLSILWLQSHGIIGVAWGTTAPRLVASLLFVPWYVRRMVGIPMSRFWITVWVRPSLAMVPFALGSWAVEQWWPAPNLFIYFAEVAATLPLAVLGAWLVSLTPEEKKRLSPRELFERLRHMAGE